MKWPVELGDSGQESTAFYISWRSHGMLGGCAAIAHLSFASFASFAHFAWQSIWQSSRARVPRIVPRGMPAFGMHLACTVDPWTCNGLRSPRTEDDSKSCI